MLDAPNSRQPRNSLRLQTQAKALRTVHTLTELKDALTWAQNHALAVLPLGEGSNVVLQPQLNALVLVIKLLGREKLNETDGHVTLRIGAGENWHALVTWSLEQGYYGLENLALIPGTVGAAPIQNIGAYGCELAPFVTAVHSRYCRDGSALSLSREECGFGYRDSVFKQGLADQLVITHVDLQLAKQPAVNTQYPALQSAIEAAGQANNATPQNVYDAVVALRRARLPDPAIEPNAGSFFKNPVVPQDLAVALQQQYPGIPVFPVNQQQRKLAAAWLIEQAGWKGQRLGGVGIHSGHALVLVNYGANSGPAILALAAKIQASVAQKFAVQLEIEPRIYGALA